MTPAPSRSLAAACLVAACAALLQACGVAPPAPGAPGVGGAVLGRNDRLALYVPRPGETTASIAQAMLGGADRAWEIEELNGASTVEPGRAIAIPLRPLNPFGVTADGYQTVPILVYHRVGRTPTRMTISPEGIAAQFEYLKANGYRVVRLSELAQFIDGRRRLPSRSVVVTFDDGHVSVYQYAYPLLRQYGYPATLFLYGDFIGAPEALKWPQLAEMAAAGLVEVQAHSRTHANLVQRATGESDGAYAARIDAELRQPRELIQRHLQTTVSHYAYPYGDANDLVLDRMAAARYSLGLTVNAGGNPFYAYPLALRRTMIYGDQDLAAFRAALQVFRRIDLR
jgi:peptidoglycan/xylan/chitin deacetylase (PgdA/CDA1 family)